MSINKSASEIEEIILDVRFPNQKIRRVFFQYGDRAWLTSEHIILLTATLHPQTGRKIGPKCSTRNVSVIRPLEYPHAVKALYIYKYPCFLRDSNPVPTVRITNSTGVQNLSNSIVTHDGLSNRKNNKQMFLNMVYALPSLQWLLRTVSAYSEPAGATFLAVGVPILQSASV
ncbi:hypothetical protein TNCV_1822331 [Trichonephila clavipes]|nr:hypothetical protein TNCV_1822331 [Trichonephila clavipes]